MTGIRWMKQRERNGTNTGGRTGQDSHLWEAQRVAPTMEPPRTVLLRFVDVALGNQSLSLQAYILRTQYYILHHTTTALGRVTISCGTVTLQLRIPIDVSPHTQTHKDGVEGGHPHRHVQVKDHIQRLHLECWCRGNIAGFNEANLPLHPPELKWYIELMLYVTSLKKRRLYFHKESLQKSEINREIHVNY